MTRCAIYTRKSSDEGLDQHFNSLDAQREACEAYIQSQAGEGWTALTARYDDGGYSGGSIKRPGLRQLLADIDRGLVDVVVVYKIDRLTRSLPDFARIVERFDARSVSFVSVTQAFNTTSSMGRLTLNVLLSFAQFEREVTGERIRDKIAASKAKGMWMGGLPPLGYDAPESSERILRVNAEEAEVVRSIFERYLELRSVHALVHDLAERGIVSKRRITREGRSTGGQPLTRGALFHLLRNRIYRGQIVHKGEVFEGRHQAIIGAELFDEVRARLAEAGPRRRRATRHRAPLAGKLFLPDGSRLTPTHSRGSSGRLYRYYAPIAGQVGHRGAAGPRLSAIKFEARLRALLQPPLAGAAHDPFDLLARITVHGDRLAMELPGSCWLAVSQVLTADQFIERRDRGLVWTVPFSVGSARVEVTSARRPVRRDPVLIRALRAAHAMLDHDRHGFPVLSKVPTPRYERRLARLAFLSPALQAAIIEGRQPPTLTLEKIVRGDVPLDWQEQALWASRRR
jgi:site-specific DNA recombinase